MGLVGLLLGLTVTRDSVMRSKMLNTVIATDVSRPVPQPSKIPAWCSETTVGEGVGEAVVVVVEEKPETQLSSRVERVVWSSTRSGAAAAATTVSFSHTKRRFLKRIAWDGGDIL